MAVVLVNYNGAEFVLECLRGIAAERPTDIVVVDNASSDGSLELVAREHVADQLIANVANRGFAAAANQGVRATKSPYVLLVNPDSTIAPGLVGTLAKTLDDHPRAGAVGALVRNQDGSVQPTKRAFPSLWQSLLHGLVGLVWPNNPGTRAYTLADASFTQPRTVDWVAATAVAIRREAFEEIGGFDESFFFFVEDVDLCRRLWDAGWEVWFEPRAEIVHAWGGSWTQRPLRFLWQHQRNLFRYVTKHRRGLWILAYPFIAAGLLLRFALLAVRWLFTRRSVPRHRAIPGRRRT
jgi:N-acetylglucosaminyl-diphospho-decaprenol L-rhamnosyltransferase